MISALMVLLMLAISTKSPAIDLASWCFGLFNFYTLSQEKNGGAILWLNLQVL